MSDPSNLRRVQEGYQPRADELSKGYRVRETVDLRNLAIPKNLGTAAVTPRPSNVQAPASPKPKP